MFNVEKSMFWVIVLDRWLIKGKGIEGKHGKMCKLGFSGWVRVGEVRPIIELRSSTFLRLSREGIWVGKYSKIA